MFSSVYCIKYRTQKRRCNRRKTLRLHARPAFHSLGQRITSISLLCCRLLSQLTTTAGNQRKARGKTKLRSQMPGLVPVEDTQIPRNMVAIFAFPWTGETQGLSDKAQFGIREQINGGHDQERPPHQLIPNCRAWVKCRRPDHKQNNRKPKHFGELPLPGTARAACRLRFGCFGRSSHRITSAP